MTYPMDLGTGQPERRPSLAMPLLVGLGAFAIGAVVTFGYVQWQSQKQQLALMSQMVRQLQQAPQTTQAVTPQPLFVLGGSQAMPQQKTPPREAPQQLFVVGGSQAPPPSPYMRVPAHRQPHHQGLFHPPPAFRQ